MADILEGAIPEVLIDSVCARGEATRPAHHRPVFPQAVPQGASVDGWVVKVEVEVARNVKIQVSIAVEVAESGARTPAVVDEPRLKLLPELAAMIQE